ncbi:ATP-binding cassette sub-family A member 2 [Frankliniella fusca]|uniref:ATP-binding cassette sub-family A member 2 n=1 Tax=Frankliniella fusca TaxID=407009 RepID=A0AAE1LQM8_9NEOP|nr:ATP-binding cassette sub-family A member 2 [Frankliniella fusca]
MGRHELLSAPCGGRAMDLLSVCPGLQPVASGSSLAALAPNEDAVGQSAAPGCGSPGSPSTPSRGPQDHPGVQYSLASQDERHGEPVTSMSVHLTCIKTYVHRMRS